MTQCSLVEMKHDFACHEDDGVILLQNVGCVYQTGQRQIPKYINLNKRNKDRRRLYITVILLSYGSVTWILTQTTEQMLNTFERKILRRIYGPIQEGDAGVPDGIMNCTPYITI